MSTIKKRRGFYESLSILKKYVDENIEEKILKYSIFSKLYMLNEEEVKNLIRVSKEYELKKDKINRTLEEYYYEESKDIKVKDWLLEIIKEKNSLQVQRETNLISKRLGITYKIKSTHFLKLTEIQNNPGYAACKKELYKQLVLNFSSNIKTENLEPTVDILVAVKNRDKEKIKYILKQAQTLQRIFKSSLTKKEGRVIKLQKLLILTYWPVGCLSRTLFNKILTKSYRYTVDEILTLKYDEILKYLRAMKNLSLNEIFYKGSRKNTNFNYFFSDFAKYTPKDFQNTLKAYLSSFEKVATRRYLQWFFKDKVPNEWEDFIFAIEYIAKHRLLNLDEKIEYIITAKFKAEGFFVSFEKTNFNPYKSSSIFENKNIRRAFLQNVINYIKNNIKKIDTYGWISFYIYADKDDKNIFSEDIKTFFKNKEFEIQNQILVYFLSFYPNFDKKHLEFILEMVLHLDENKITIPKEIIRMQRTNTQELDYYNSYILIKSLILRTRVFNILHRNIQPETMLKSEGFRSEKLLPAICYIAHYSNPNALREEVAPYSVQREEIMKFISFLAKDQSKSTSGTR
ncbi:BB_0208 family protein [Borrelia sp. BU AG58]|uniref:BB_0208 family protein n=1 Tax=Borrelia sp. BU AG58 TaxID=2887345 RepID=UPI001E2F0FB8|nr:BB_0208 family protein [Borrelia sp. BU AG58]UER67403.1 BB_0208 family protein [Borrelia sp. BU AG58]